MVNVGDVYMVMTTIAVLHEPLAVKNIPAKELEEIVSPPISVGGSIGGIVIGSQRDQIEIVAANNKTDVRDLSGRKDFSGSKIGKALELFTGKFGLRVKSYGINFVLRVPCFEPEKWITQNILSPGISEKTGKTLVGGSVAVAVKSGNKTLNIKFEPTEDQKLVVNFNASEATTSLPSAAMLSDEMTEQWNSMVRFLGDLGL